MTLDCVMVADNTQVQGDLLSLVCSCKAKDGGT